MKKSRFLRRVTVALAVMLCVAVAAPGQLAFASENAPGDGDTGQPRVTYSVQVNNNVLRAVGDTVMAHVYKETVDEICGTVEPIPGALVSWDSSDNSVVTVDGNGLVTAVGSGVALVTANIDGVTYSVNIVVVEVIICDGPYIAVYPSVLNMTVGESEECFALYHEAYSAYPGFVEANEILIWESENTNIATVDAKGKVTAVASGTTEIRVIHPEDYVQSSISVTVTAPIVDDWAELAVSPGTLDLTVGESAACRAIFRAEGSSEFVEATSLAKWESENTGIATVDADGKVTAVEPGKGIIKVTYSTADTVYIVVNVSAADVPSAGDDKAPGGSGENGGKVTDSNDNEADVPAVAVAKVALKKVKTGKRSAVVTWKKAAKNVTAYQIQYRVSGTSKWKTKTVYAYAKTYKATLKNLKKNKKYQIRIRAYRMLIGDKYYGDWSNIKTSGKIK